MIAARQSSHCRKHKVWVPVRSERSPKLKQKHDPAWDRHPRILSLLTYSLRFTPSWPPIPIVSCYRPCTNPDASKLFCWINVARGKHCLTTKRNPTRKRWAKKGGKGNASSRLPSPTLSLYYLFIHPSLLHTVEHCVLELISASRR